MDNESERAPNGVIVGWVVVLMSWVFASMIGNGSELPKLALLFPPLILGSILCVSFSTIVWRSWLLVALAIVAGYFIVRAANSPVFDLGRRDVFLVAAGWLGVVSGGSALQYRSCRGIFLGILVFVLLGHAWVSFIQGLHEPRFAFFRLSREDTVGVSGFYYHRNYLAGCLEIMVPVFVAFAAAQSSLQRSGFFIIITLFAIILCFFTNSRGGFGVMLLGAAASFFLQTRVGRGSSTIKRFGWKGVVFVLGLLIALGVGFLLLSKILSNREGIAGGVEGRLAMAGIAIDGWLLSPLIGSGSHAYSYLFPRFYGGLGGWYGDAEMAHSDYLQALCDYGLLGLLGILLLLITFAFVTFQQKEARRSGGWLLAAGGGALAAEAVRAAFDFNLHIAPNLMLFSFVVAGALVKNVVSAPAQTYFESKLWRGFVFVCVLAASTCALVAGWREVLAVKKWWQLEQVMLRSSNAEEKREALREMCEAAPSFELLRSSGQMSLQLALLKGEGFGLATSDWRNAVERHPFDGESLANYARCLDEGKEFGSAETIHARALEAVSRRENKYGVIFGVGWHFVKRAEDALSKRQSGRALFLYHEADACFRESYLRNFKRTTSNREAADWVRGRIDFLEGARIEPVELPVLDWRAHIE